VLRARQSGLPETCLNFDIANACLGFIDGMHLVGNLIERGQIDFGLVVDGESSRTVVEATLARLSQDSCDAQMLRDQLATLTVGSGAAAMILAHTRLAPGGIASTAGPVWPRPNTISSAGASSTSDHRHAQPVAPRRGAGAKDLGAGAKGSGLERRIRRSIALHQVSELHTQELARAVGFDLAKAFLIYPELGNVGPASVPMVLSKAVEAERVSPGDHVVLGGIGSGLNCTVAGVTW